MRIRDLAWRGDVVWPPEWWPAEPDFIISKNGVLKKVSIQDIENRYLQVEIETAKGPSWGVILLEDPDHLEILYQKLKENLYRPVTEIGDLEMDLKSLQKYGAGPRAAGRRRDRSYQRFWSPQSGAQS